MSRDYYAVLEVERWSDAPTVEHAYHTQARRFRGLDQRGPGRDVDSRALRHIEQAFHVLGEPQLRGSYDRALLDMLETAPPRNDDIIQMLEVSFDQAALGGKVAVERIAPSGPDQVDVHLPRGVDEGTLLRIGGLGMRDEPGDHAGDLILLVHIRPHPRLRRDGLDLYLDVTVPTDVARHGGRVRAGTLEGEVELNIPAGVRGGEKLLLRRAGLLDEANRRGDLYAVVQLQMSTLDQPVAKAPDAPAQRDSTADHAELAESLDRRMRQLTRDETEIEHRRTVTRNWEKQLAGRQAQIDQRAAAIAHRRRRLSALRAAMKQRRRQIAEASAAAPPDVQIDMRPLHLMQEKLEARERELAHQQQRLWEHRERFDRDKADFDRERRDHARAVRVLEDQRDQLAREAESLDQRRAELQRDADQLDQQRADHEHILAEFAERQQQFEADSARLAADRTALDERINDIAEQQAKIDQRVRHLDERDATFQRHEADLNRQRAELASAGEQVESDRQAKLAAVQAEIEEDRRAMKSQRDQLVALQQQLDQQAAELDDQRQRIAVVTTNLERRRRRLHRQRTLLREKSVAARQAAAPTEPPVISAVENLRLVMLAPGGQRRTITPTGSSVFIGRDGACDLCIPVSTVSRRHCRIEASDGAVILRDVGSKNGTYHNGQPVTEATLREGDSIAIGPVHFTVAAAE
ncbi:FHA domain-containing protein [Planctomycetales bacterium ZRK34]|nr:FHA domain-containing protein [Planctomycetales bacterium ZRK34]